MGRKSKKPVSIKKTEVRTEISPLSDDGLPPLKNFVDVFFDNPRGHKFLSRVFIVEPTTDKEINELLEIKEKGEFVVTSIGIELPLANHSGRHQIIPPVFTLCIDMGFGELFADQIARLNIKFFEGTRKCLESVKQHLLGLRQFIEFLSNKVSEPSSFSVEDITKDMWIEFRELMINDPRTTAKSIFNSGRRVFADNKSTAFNGWLKNLRFKTRNKSVSKEHTSEMFRTNEYSENEMYQFLAVFVEGFDRRIGFLKKYESVTEADVPKDWFYPGRKLVTNRAMRENTEYDSETHKLLHEWLSNRDAGYEIVLNHHILHLKNGGSFRNCMRTLEKKSKSVPLLRDFQVTMAELHGYKFKPGEVREDGKFNPSNASKHFESYYKKKSSASETNAIQDQISFCLMTLLMMQTGINKEVALSIPALAENGKSILSRQESLFVGNKQSTEIELYGYKSKTGTAPIKKVLIPIIKNQPLYEMLVEYERYFKVGSCDQFFEFGRGVDARYPVFGLANFEESYPVVGDDGELITSLDSKKFRKVFASSRLLGHLNSVKDANELVDKLKSDLSHADGSFDTTFANYLMKTSAGRGVIDIAIATITSEKLNEGIRFRGKVKVSQKKSTKVRKGEFLCDCKDPYNPTHGIDIHERCMHYDLCLGCERSVIYKEHLPYICIRIMQYEKMRKISADVWSVMFEDRWMIAHDALDQYEKKDKKNGKQMVSDAWEIARSGQVTLAPIIGVSEV